MLVGRSKRARRWWLVLLLAAVCSLGACSDGQKAVDNFLDEFDPDDEDGDDVDVLLDELLLRDCRDEEALEGAQGAEPVVVSFKATMAVESGGVFGPEEPIYVRLPQRLDGVSVTVAAGADETLLALLDDGTLIDVPDASPSKGRTLNFPFNAESILEDTCLAIYPMVDGGQNGQQVDVHVVAKGQAGMEQGFPVQMAIVGDTEFSDDALDAMANFANNTFVSHGAPPIIIDEVFEVEGPSIIDDEGDELDQLIDEISAESGLAINVIILQGFEEPGVLGFAGGVPGPVGVQTVTSAVVLSIDAHLDAEGDLDTDELGSTLAHEIGHQLGLFHTTEESGDDFDPIADTDQCDLDNDANDDGIVEFDECADVDGTNLMFYESGSEATSALSPTQVQVLSAHPMAF